MINFTRLPGYDINGNPRYVCHYSNLLTEKENLTVYPPVARGEMSERYKIAIKRAHKLGGRKYHTKSYGGGIVFQSYNIGELERDIIELVKKESGE